MVCAMGVLGAVDLFATFYHHLPKGAFANALHLLAFEHPIKFLLCEQRFKELRLFARQYNLLVAVFVV